MFGKASVWEYYNSKSKYLCMDYFLVGVQCCLSVGKCSLTCTAIKDFESCETCEA